MGRPTKLTEEVEEKIVRYIRLGMTYKRAAFLAGIGERTFYDWKERGLKGEKKYSQFLQALKEAEAQAEMRLLATIEKAGKTQWQANAWILERRFPERWGRKDRLQLDHSIHRDYEKDLSKKERDEIKLLAKKAREEV